MAFNRLAIRVIALGLIFMAGCIPTGIMGTQFAHRTKRHVVYSPLPHHVPPHPRGLSFRFAMIHDVIHERYPRHGEAFYRERERLARQRLAEIQQITGTTKTREAFDLMDDIGAGLARTWKVDQAVTLLQNKLALQQATVLPQGEQLPESERYTTYANLGTFMVEANLAAMQRGDPVARQKVNEGRDWIAQAMQANANAHFGREIWQRQFFDYLLDAQTNPELLKQFDMLGNSLEPMDVYSYAADAYDTNAPRPYNTQWNDYVHPHLTDQKRITITQLEADRDKVRRTVKHIGGAKNRKPSVPFDEPMVGLIGMWRQGMGANPHYALCMGETMLRVGQRYLAWSCYERAKGLATQFWPTKEAQNEFLQHCNKRQVAIELSLKDKGTASSLRAEFERELARGQQYQREYQAYTTAKIKAGVAINAPDFYDEFHQQHKPIARKPGPEEWYVFASERHQIDEGIRYFGLFGITGGGLLVFLAALAYRRQLVRRARCKEANLPSTPNP